MAIFKSLTFDGVNSLDYGIYITGEAVYNAPERAVELVNIAGKNGALVLDQGRFENIEVTYHAGCFADNQEDFARKVMEFRNVLASRFHYVRLSDEYHSDEYRMALYKDGLEVDAVQYSTAGEFDITFNAKPQRFLTSGEVPVTADDWSDVQTESGSLVTIDNDGSLAVKSLEVALEPIQDLNGYDKPWVGGAGKNKLPYPYDSNSQTINGVTFTVNSDGTVKVNGTATAETNFSLLTGKSLASIGLTSATYTLNGCPSGGSITTYRIQVRHNGTWNGDIGSGVNFTYNASSPVNDLVRINVLSGTTVNNLTFHPMIRLASETDATYEPYENICPISGHDSVDVIVSPTTSASDGTTYTTSLGRTVYGGTLDVTSGVLTVDRANIASYNGETLPSTWISDRDEYASGTTPTTGAQVVYKLATPQTYQLTPQEIDLLTGTNNVWSDGGDVTLEYGTSPWYNPTPFDAKPLIKVTGTGTVQINDVTIAISESPTTIDCEAMEAYNGTESRNGDIVLTPNEFPTLHEGMNEVEAGSGITALEITPRWWRV